MRQRQEGDAKVVFVQLVHVERDIQVRRQVAMGKHDALGRAGRTRGVDECGQIVGLGQSAERFQLGIVIRRRVAQERLHGHGIGQLRQHRP